MAGRTCTVCSHPERPAIDGLLATGETSIRAISRHFGLTHHALLRHGAHHLPKLLALAVEAERVTEADRLVAEMQSLHVLSKDLTAEAREEGDIRGALLGVGQQRGTLETLWKVHGELGAWGADESGAGMMDRRAVVNMLTASLQAAFGDAEPDIRHRIAVFLLHVGKAMEAAEQAGAQADASTGALDTRGRPRATGTQGPRGPWQRDVSRRDRHGRATRPVRPVRPTTGATAVERTPTPIPSPLPILPSAALPSPSPPSPPAPPPTMPATPVAPLAPLPGSGVWGVRGWHLSEQADAARQREAEEDAAGLQAYLQRYVRLPSDGQRGA